MENKYTVIRDTREKEGWYFPITGNCAGMIDKKLDTGDYSILGLEDRLCIERKRSVSEIAGNITQKRFVKEIERIKSYKYKHFIFEFPLEDVINFPQSTRLPPSLIAKIRISSNFLQSVLTKYQEEHDIIIHYCKNKFNAFLKAKEIMETVYGKETENRPK